MYLKSTTYTEEAWGAPYKQVETELIANKYEVEDKIIDQLFDDETYPAGMVFTFLDDYTEYDLTIEGEEYIDADLVIDYLDGLEEGEINKDVLYARAGVVNPKQRVKK